MNTKKYTSPLIDFLKKSKSIGAQENTNLNRLSVSLYKILLIC
jgi:hypothetical protein